MKEKGILFRGQLVDRILLDEKTETRRLDLSWVKVKKGTVLWTRENFSTCYDGPEAYEIIYTNGFRRGFSMASNATEEQLDWLEKSMNVHGERGRPSIHQPRWATRCLLEVTADGRLERLQDITESGAFAEGIDTEGDAYNRAEHAQIGGVPNVCPAIHAFADLWDSIHLKDHPWASNPVLAVVPFKKIWP